MRINLADLAAGLGQGIGEDALRRAAERGGGDAGGGGAGAAFQPRP